MNRMRVLALGVLCLALGACSSKVTRYYMLHSTLSRPEVAVADAKRVGVWKVRMPEYLERGEIVSRRQSEQLGLSSLERWGEPLSENFTAVLAANLTALCPNFYVAVLPAPYRPRMDTEFRTRVQGFERNGDVVRLTAEVAFLGPDSKEAGLSTLRVEQGCGGTDINSTVECMNRALLEYSRKVAALPLLACAEAASTPQ